MKYIIASLPIILTGCIASMPTLPEQQSQAQSQSPAKKIELPPKGSVYSSSWEPKGCEQKKELIASEGCQQMDQSICSKNALQSLVNQAGLYNATHLWLTEEKIISGELYKKAIAYDCTKFVNNKGAR